MPQAPRVKKVIPKTDAQLKDIEKAISRCFLFSSLCEAQRKEVGVRRGTHHVTSEYIPRVWTLSGFHSLDVLVGMYRFLSCSFLLLHPIYFVPYLWCSVSLMVCCSWFPCTRLFLPFVEQRVRRLS